MKKNAHLTPKERSQIEILLQGGYGVSEIGEKLGRDKSVISRELARNGSKDGEGNWIYDGDEAQETARGRRAQLRGPRKETPQIMERIKSGLERGWSPEQMVMDARKGKEEFVSHQWIYEAIDRDKQKGGKLFKKLWRKRHGRRPRSKEASSSRIPNRVAIGERPDVVNDRKRYGDWEVDLIEGRGGGYILTCVERKSRFSVLSKLESKRADEVARAQERALAPFVVHTVTRDNGLEFARHQEVNERLGCKSYFCEPYHSWERGLVENRNGLVRRYYPKGSSFEEVGRKELEKIEEIMNNLPHRVLDGKAPVDFFDQIKFVN